MFNFSSRLFHEFMVMRISLKRFLFVSVTSLYLLLPCISISQERIGNESLAIEYFKKKNYEKALPIFTQLINRSPDNAMFNYYYGVCLLKNNSFETAAKEALLNAVVDKTPSNSNFYLGNYFHAIGNWTEALEFYKRYRGSNQERQELEYDKYFNLCLKQINPFKIDKGDETTVFVDSIKATVPPPDEKNFPIPDSLRTEWFNFQINSQLIYHGITDFRGEAAKILFAKAWIATGKNDSIVRNTDVLRKAHEETNNVAARIGLVQRIVDAEQQSYQLLRDREKYFEQARVKEAAYWEKAGVEAITAFITEIEGREKARNEKFPEKNKHVDVSSEKVPIINNSEPVQQTDNEENQSSNTDNIVFKVQIGSFKNGKLTPAFKTIYSKLSKFRKIDMYVDDKKYSVYTVGNFAKYKDASLLKNQLIMEGAKGAFLAAFNNGKRVPVISVAKDIPSK